MSAPDQKQRLSLPICLAILLCACILAFWPLSFHVFSLKNDALNYFLPVRRLVSEALWLGEDPFWSPYFNLGYPLHGDMQSGLWNPVVHALSLFGPYTLYTLQIETLIYIYLSGVSMFFLSRYFVKDHTIALFTGSAFMLCGFNTDSTQFLNWIAGASWIPFIILFYHRLLHQHNWRDAIYCGFFLFLLFTTAYPADFILTAYLLLFFSIAHFFVRENRDRKGLTSFLKHHLLLAFSFILLSLPAIVSYAEFLPLSERGSGASFEDVMSNPFHPALTISYLAPFAAWKAYFAGITDPLERNSYFGIIPFILLLSAMLYIKGNRTTRFLKWGFVITLLFSFGAMGGLRVLAYHALPLMDTFRHPANAKLFTILFAVLLSGFALGHNKDQKQRKTPFYLTVLLCILLAGWSLFNGGASITLPVAMNTDTLKKFLDSLGFFQLALISIIVQLPFLLGYYFYFLKKGSTKGLAYLSLANLVIVTALIQPFTVVKKDSAASIQAIINRVKQDGYSLPSARSSLAENSAGGMQYFEEIGASNLYNKKPGRVHYRISPSNLLVQNKFWFDDRLREQVMQLLLIHGMDQNSRIDSIQILNFRPGRIQFRLRSSTGGNFALVQNQYPRWSMFINGKKEKIEAAHIAFMGFQLAPGQHQISFEYRSIDLWVLLAISYLAILAIIALAFRNRRSLFQ